jgi:DNA-binding MarR family transcriptional regulator/GNAT superfamily N-acetyltransferase
VTVTTHQTGIGEQTRHQIESVREFNRFYTRLIGVLNRDYLDSPFSLAEGRVLMEIYYRRTTTASVIIQALGIDAGYLSRILRGFERRGLLAKPGSTDDARQKPLSLSRAGRKAFEELEARQREVLANTLKPVDSRQRAQLIGSMHKIRRILDAPAEDRAPYTLRSLRPGDIGWVTHRQGIIYYEEYGWDERFEALCGEILARFVQNFDAKHERAWIAERDGEIVGAIFCVRKSATVAQLRLLYVEPTARGLGIGTRLVDECVEFARRNGYRKMMLWTNSVLDSARRIYERKGFCLVKEERHHSFGKNLVGQNWELDLKGSQDGVRG